MSRASAEQALTGLIPTLNGPLPPELLQLSLSLLARSRSVAHSLKPDEEIARPYACAQLACERLKKRLNLPAIASRPPCPPRIYKKLYNYLNSALPATLTPRGPDTPSKTTTSTTMSARGTPKSPLSGRKTPRSASNGQERVGEPPGWVMPAIRELVKAFNYAIAAPHIYTGVESILPQLAQMSAASAEMPSKRPRRAATASKVADPEVSGPSVLGLIAVIFLYVFTRMRDEHITPEQYQEWRETTVNTLLSLPAAQATTFEELSLQMEQLMPVAQTEGWLQMEWFLNIMPHSGGMATEGVEATDSMTSLTIGQKGRTRAGASDYIGLGTMFQDATDYLGERQRQEYSVWKTRIIARIEELEAA